MAQWRPLVMVMKVDKFREVCSPGGRNHTDDEDEKGEEGGEREREEWPTTAPQQPCLLGSIPNC